MCVHSERLSEWLLGGDIGGSGNASFGHGKMAELSLEVLC